MRTLEDARFWDRIARRYAAKRVKDNDAYERKLDMTQRYLSDTSQVMEFACGTGTTAILQAPFADHIDAIDFSKEMIDIAREKADRAGIRNVSFHVSSIEDWQAPDGSYDMVMGHSILHLIRDREAALEKIFHLLKPGGVFVSNTACIADSFPIFKWIGPMGRVLGLLPYLEIFTADRLRVQFADSGFEILEEFQPKKSDALFLIARKQDVSDESDLSVS